MRVPLDGVKRWPWRRFASIGVFSLLVLVWVAEPLVAQGRWDALGLVVFALVVVPVVTVGAVRWRREITPEIILGPDRVLLPLPRADHTLNARYRDIEALFVRDDARRGFLWIGTAGATLVYPLGAFAKPTDAHQVRDAIRLHIEERVPEGPARLAEFDSQQDIADQAYGRRLWGLKTILALLVAVFIVEELAGGTDRLFALERFGAHAPLLVREMGHWWRLVTANLLHVHLVHLVIDVSLLALLGGFLERLLGARAFLLSVLLGGVLAQAAVLVSGRAELMVGSAPLACAVLGAFAFTLVRCRGRIPLGFSPAFRQWLMVGMLLGATLLMVSPHALPGYLGGFLGGVLVAAAALERDPPLPLAVGRPTAFSLVLAALAALWLVAIGCAVHYGTTAGPAARIRLVEEHLAANRGSSHSLNRLAWEIGTDREATPHELDLAHTAAERAVEREEDQPLFADTLATVEFRRGDTDSAIDRERALLGQNGDGFYASQLARFLVRRHAETGPRYVGMDPWPGALEFEQHPSRGIGVRARGPGVAGPFTVYTLVFDGEDLAGLLRFYVPGQGAGAPGSGVRVPGWLARQGVENVFGTGATFVPALVVAGREASRAWLMDDGARLLP